MRGPKRVAYLTRNYCTGNGTSALATDLVEFVRLRYPQREKGGMVIALCNAGETWQGVGDPAERVCALWLDLPRLIAVGRNQR